MNAFLYKLGPTILLLIVLAIVALVLLSGDAPLAFTLACAAIGVGVVFNLVLLWRR